MTEPRDDRSLATRKYEKQKRKRLWILLGGLALAIFIMGIVTAIGAHNYRTNPDLIRIRDHEEQETNQDGSLKWKKIYGSSGILQWEYEDLGDTIQEIEYQHYWLEEKEYHSPKTITEKDKEGHLIRKRTYDLGKLIEDIEY